MKGKKGVEMIDIATEEVLSFADAVKRLPRRRGGARPHIATLYRWAQHGVRGIRLETIMVGATRCTSVEKLQAYFDALTSAADGQAPAPAPLPRARRAAIAAAEKRLREAGIC